MDDFETDARAYWTVFLSEPYNIELYERALNTRRHVLERTDDGQLFRRVVRYEPQNPVPGILKPVLSSLEYTETDLLDWGSGTMLVTSQSTILKDAFSLSATYTVVPHGAGGCRRTFQGDLRLSVKLVGGVAEEWLVGQLRRNNDVATELLRRYLVGPTPDGKRTPPAVH